MSAPIKVAGVPLAIAACLALGLPAMPAYAGPPRGDTGTRAPRPPTRGPVRPNRTGTPPTKPTTPPAKPPTGEKQELSGDEGAGPGGGPNECRRLKKGEKFKITLPPEAELKDLVEFMTRMTCQHFIWNPSVRGGKVTILAPEEVTVAEAYGAFYASLQSMGLTVEPSGKYFKIVESTDAKSKTLPVYGPGGRAPNNDRFVTQLFRVEGGNSADIVTLIDKLKSKQGSVDQVGDLIILTDTGTSVQRLMKIVRQVDDPATSAEKIFFFQLQYADAEETAEILREIFGEKEAAKKKKKKKGSTTGRSSSSISGDEPGFSRVVVDDRTGTLIIVAPQEDYRVIRRLIEQLDVPLAGGGGRIHVYKLKNADPEEVANVLTQLGSGANRGGNRGGAGGRSGARGGAGGQQGAAPPGGATAELFSGDIKVTADPATRSLVILASNTDYKALLGVIKDLDAERLQVYIEVYLLELSIDKNFEAGASAHFGAPFDVNAGQTQGQGLGFVASSPAGQNSLLLDTSILNGLAGGVLGPEIPGSGQFLGLGRDIPAFGVLIQAIQFNNDVNLVAEPHLYTADNQEAAIEVGRNVPTPGALTFPGGGQGGGLVPVQSVQRQDVTLNVKVTPHINDEKTVTLDVEMENNDIESIDPVLGVTTTKRRLKLDKILARDDQPIVLGGLVQEVERENTNQVPGLGQIPLLGWLFKRKVKSKEKRNLLMVLVPHILKTPDDARRIHRRRMQERLEFLERETAFKRRDLDTHVNYRKKSGLLAEINRAAVEMEEQDVFLQEAELELQQQEITGEIGMSPSLAAPPEEEVEKPSSTRPMTPPPRSPPSSTGTKPRKPK